MLQIIGIVVVVLAVGAAVYYFGFYKKGKINDRDGDYIPDEVEDAVEDVKRRAKNVKQELKDVADAAKEVVNQAGDVAAAAKGKTRRGRKPRRSSKKK